MTITDQTIDTCNALLRGEISAVETYTQAIETFDTSASDTELERIRVDHQQNVLELQKLVTEYGGEPATGSGAWGGFVQAIEGTATLLGESPALKILQTGEAHGINQYENALANTRKGQETILDRFFRSNTHKQVNLPSPKARSRTHPVNVVPLKVLLGQGFQGQPWRRPSRSRRGGLAEKRRAETIFYPSSFCLSPSSSWRCAVNPIRNLATLLRVTSARSILGRMQSMPSVHEAVSVSSACSCERHLQKQGGARASNSWFTKSSSDNEAASKRAESSHCAPDGLKNGKRKSRLAALAKNGYRSRMSTLVEIESAVALSAGEKAELLLFVAQQLRAEQAPLPEPRLFTKDQLQAWMDEDEEDMRRFLAAK